MAKRGDRSTGSSGPSRRGRLIRRLVLGGALGAPVEPVVRVALESLSRQPSVIAGWGNYLRANLAVRLGSRPLVVHAAKQVGEGNARPELR